MFGTIVADYKIMSPDEVARYRAYYCGLCRRLGAHFGSIGSSTLTFDMTFLTLLLSSLYELDEETASCRCAARPIKRHEYICTQATDYAAYMNLILAYYQCMDDWNDDHSRSALGRGRKIEPFLPAIREAYPRQCGAITGCLKRLGAMEAANEMNPDLPANCFGELMGELFVWREHDRYAHDLWRMGAALGRFVYLLDAVNDLRSDIKKERYNPLVAQTDTNFTPVLTIFMAECTEIFETLPASRDRHILQNVLYSGVWQSYVRKPERMDAQDERSV